MSRFCHFAAFSLAALLLAVAAAAQPVARRLYVDGAAYVLTQLVVRVPAAPPGNSSSGEEHWRVTARLTDEWGDAAGVPLSLIYYREACIERDAVRLYRRIVDPDRASERGWIVAECAGR